MSDIREYIINNYDGLMMLPEQFDDCIIGMAERCSFGIVVAYDTEKILEKIMQEYQCDYEDALDNYSHDFVGYHHGETTPVFISTIQNLPL